QVSLDWWYRSSTDLLVDPPTGIIVDGSQRANQWLADGRGVRRLTVATTRLADDPETVRQHLALAAGYRRALAALRLWPLLVGPLLALALIAVAVVRWGPAREADAAPGPDRRARDRSTPTLGPADRWRMYDPEELLGRRPA